MKVMFLHLSDLHLIDKRGFNQFQIEKMVDAAISVGTVDHLVIVISGDIAFSGQASQYRQAQKCVKHIISYYKEKAQHQEFINICCVPGNHDIAFPANDEGKLNSEKLQKIHKVNACEKHIESQTSLQAEFFKFSKYVARCDWGDDLQFHRSIYTFGDFRIEFNLINSGIFSTLEEDKGLHYMSQHCINDLITPSGADLAISVMHHAPEWYTDDIKHQLEEALYTKSSIVFLGHEHYIARRKITLEDKPSVVIQAGGCLCNNDDWKSSSFFTGILDTETYEYRQQEFVWNSHERQYEGKESQPYILPRKPSMEKQLFPKDGFVRELVRDPKHDHLSDDFRSYFVFPRIQQQNSEGIIEREIISEDDFLSEVLEKKRILIYGGYNLGKSTLLKKVFLSLSETCVPVLCDLSNIHGKNTERMIRNSFEDTYGSDSSDYERFLQMPKQKKVVIVDDADQITRDSFDVFMDYLNQHFEVIILSSKQVFDLDILQRAKAILDAENTLYRYTILPFYADKRRELIHNIVDIKTADKSTVPKTVDLLSAAISSQRRSIILDPDFIINYAEYYCNNIGEVNNSDSSVFSKVFEANIVMSISPFSKGKLSVNKIFTILGKIAHFIHFNKAYPISYMMVKSVIEYYNEEYGDNVSVRNFIDIIEKSKIMIKEEESNGEIAYRFSSRNYLAYFVAREVNAEYNSSHDPSDLQKILRCSCFGINADVLLFISYITDNVQILNALLAMAESLVNEWMEFDFDGGMPQYLKATTYKQIAPPQKGDYEREQKAIVESEKAEFASLRIADIYDYSDEAAEEIANQLIRACSLLVVISKCLPGFEHNMKKPEKERFVEMIYKMPNRIFGKWAHLTEQAIPDFIDYFRSQGEDYYQRNAPASEDDILRALQNASISLLLDLYNLSALYSTKENTFNYLSSFDHGERSSYSLEFLMMIEKAKHTSTFTDKAIELFDKNESAALMTCIAYVVRHALVFVRDFQPPQFDRLCQKFFATRESKAQLMSQRYLRPGAQAKE